MNGDSPSQEKKSQIEIAEEKSSRGKAGQYGQDCNECDGSGIVNEGGCLVCKDCGWSKCE